MKDFIDFRTKARCHAKYKLDVKIAGAIVLYVGNSPQKSKLARN